MIISINENICKENGLDISELLAILLIKSCSDLPELLKSLEDRKVIVKDTTGAGDAFCAGASIGLTYGKTFAEAIEIGSRLAASVITSSENVCPRFLPKEFGIDIEVEED